MDITSITDLLVWHIRLCTYNAVIASITRYSGTNVCIVYENFVAFNRSRELFWFLAGSMSSLHFYWLTERKFFLLCWILLTTFSSNLTQENKLRCESTRNFNYVGFSKLRHYKVVPSFTINKISLRWLRFLPMRSHKYEKYIRSVSEKKNVIHSAYFLLRSETLFFLLKAPLWSGKIWSITKGSWTKLHVSQASY